MTAPDPQTTTDAAERTDRITGAELVEVISKHPDWLNLPVQLLNMTDDAVWLTEIERDCFDPNEGFVLSLVAGAPAIAEPLVNPRPAALPAADAAERCPVPCDDDCEAVCHATHDPSHKRTHHWPEDCPAADQYDWGTSYANAAVIRLRKQRAALLADNARMAAELEQVREERAADTAAVAKALIALHDVKLPLLVGLAVAELEDTFLSRLAHHVAPETFARFEAELAKRGDTAEAP